MTKRVPVPTNATARHGLTYRTVTCFVDAFSICLAGEDFVNCGHTPRPVVLEVFAPLELTPETKSNIMSEEKILKNTELAFTFLWAGRDPQGLFVKVNGRVGEKRSHDSGMYLPLFFSDNVTKSIHWTQILQNTISDHQSRRLLSQQRGLLVNI